MREFTLQNNLFLLILLMGSVLGFLIWLDERTDKKKKGKK